MTDHYPVRRALISVSDKTGLAEFGRALAARGVEMLSTGGTARVLGHDAQAESQRIRERVGVLPEGFDVYGRLTGRQHVAFVSESTIFSGDVVVHDDGAFDYGSFGRTDMDGQSRERLVESIRTLLERMPDGVEHMYAGHGGEFHGDVRDVIETALGRAEKREPKYPDG